MNTDIATRDVDGWAPMLPAVGNLAGKIAGTNFVPKSLRGKPDEVAACILTGRELGIGPMESLSKIFVVDGRPTMSAELMRSLVLRAGHEMHYSTLTDAKVTVEGRRAGSDKWTSVTWSMDDAKRVGLTGKDTWKKHPRQMLAARATSELCRLLFPDALGGVSFTPEEIEETDAAPATVTVGRARKTAAPVAEPAVVLTENGPVAFDAETGEIKDPGEVVDAEIVEDEPRADGPTGAQMKMLGALMREVGLTDRDAVLQYVSGVIGRPVLSRNDLTRKETGTVIDALTELAVVGNSDRIEVSE